MRLITKTAGAAIAGVGLGLIGAPMAGAAPILFSDYSCSAGVCTGHATTGATSTDFQAMFDIPQFNPALGVLSAMSVTAGGSVNSTASVSATTDATNVQVQTDSKIRTTTAPETTVLGGQAVLVGSNGGDANLTYESEIFPSFNFGNLNAGQTAGPQPFSGNFSAFNSNAIDPNLIGLSTFNIQFGSGTFSTIGSGNNGNVTFNLTNTDTINMTVTYDYCPTGQNCSGVPEPDSFAVLAVGMLGLWTMRRRFIRR